MKKSMLNNPNHLILEAPHPSPLSAYRGFFGSRPFSKTNNFLKEHGVDPIDWQNPTVSGIKVTDGTLTIGVRYQCNKNSWGTLDDVTLHRVGN